MEKFRDRREGFLVVRDRFQLPADAMEVEPKTKRALTICNLFVNHNMALSDIVRVLEENTQNVIRALLEHEIIRDRRAKPRLGSGQIESVSPQI